MALGVIKARVSNVEFVKRTGTTAYSAASLVLKTSTDGVWTELEVTDNSGVVTRFNPQSVFSVTMGNV